MLVYLSDQLSLDLFNVDVLWNRLKQNESRLSYYENSEEED